MDYYEYGLAGLLLVCFISSSLWPLGSEIFVLGFVELDFNVSAILIVATLGNTLGSLSTYYLAYFLGYSGIKRFFPKAYGKIDFYAKYTKRYGAVCAFFSFLPFIGDIFVLLLGLHRYNQYIACFCIALGKCVRYAFLIYFYLLWK